MEDPRFQLLAMDETSEEISTLIRKLDDATTWGVEPAGRHLAYLGPAKWHLLVCVGNELAAKVAIMEREVLIGKDLLVIGGIGGVTTAPQFQNKGFASQALTLATDFIQNDIDVPFALLTCLNHRKGFYEARGWEAVDEPVFCEQPDGRVQLNIPGQWVMARTFKPARPMGPIDLLGFPF
jgi:hypothetical protein